MLTKNGVDILSGKIHPNAKDAVGARDAEGKIMCVVQVVWDEPKNSSITLLREILNARIVARNKSHIHLPCFPGEEATMTKLVAPLRMQPEGSGSQTAY